MEVIESQIVDEVGDDDDCDLQARVGANANYIHLEPCACKRSRLKVVSCFEKPLCFSASLCVSAVNLFVQSKKTAETQRDADKALS